MAPGPFWAALAGLSTSQSGHYDLTVAAALGRSVSRTKVLLTAPASDGHHDRDRVAFRFRGIDYKIEK